MEEFAISPFNYFLFLQKCRTPPKGTIVLFEVPVGNLNFTLKFANYWKTVNFRLYICQLVNNAISCFPTVESYTITCKNEIGQVSKLILAPFDEIAEDGNPSMGKIETSEFVHYMSLHEIKDLYIANYGDPNLDVVIPLMVFLYMDSEYPSITCNYTINNKEIKNANKS